MEAFSVISGHIDKSKELDYISNIASERYGQYKKSHHDWINSIEPGKYRSSLEDIRSSPIIFQKIKEEYPNTRVESVKEADEVYWSVSPDAAKGSDRSLVDCHYDSPFATIPTGGIVYYIIILAVNHNNTVTTIFPTVNKRVTMDKGDFQGMDCNNDLHCVEGSIPQNKYRILLKLHYLIVPKHISAPWEKFVRNMNVSWNFLSRACMQISADPQNIFEYMLGYIINCIRIIFNNFTLIMVSVLFLYFMYYMIRPFKKLLRYKRGNYSTSR
jgi:hypothetical protein